MDFYFNAHKHVCNLNYIHKSVSTQVSIQTHQLGPFFKVLFLLGLRISTDSKTCFLRVLTREKGTFFVTL